MFESLRDYSNPNSLGSKMRRKRFKHIETLVRKTLDSQATCSILDIGGTAQYWALMNPELLDQCAITIHNLEKPRGQNPKINTPKNGNYQFIYGDGRDLSNIKDNQFDIAHSNSVIEHVGRFHDMAQFAKELMRVGELYYIQTPNLWFPIEPHYGVPFVHWLPVPVRAKLLAQWNLGYHKKYHSLPAAFRYAEHINLLNKTSLESLTEEPKMEKERMLFLTKSLIAVGPQSKLA